MYVILNIGYPTGSSVNTGQKHRKTMGTEYKTPLILWGICVSDKKVPNPVISFNPSLDISKNYIINVFLWHINESVEKPCVPDH